jgi:hypothetical protein
LRSTISSSPNALHLTTRTRRTGCSENPTDTGKYEKIEKSTKNNPSNRFKDPVNKKETKNTASKKGRGGSRIRARNTSQPPKGTPKHSGTDPIQIKKGNHACQKPPTNADHGRLNPATPPNPKTTRNSESHQTLMTTYRSQQRKPPPKPLTTPKTIF